MEKHQQVPLLFWSLTEVLLTVLTSEKRKLPTESTFSFVESAGSSAQRELKAARAKRGMIWRRFIVVYVFLPLQI